MITSPSSILIVDDDPAGRAMLGLSLRSAGYRVKTARDGAEAINLLKTESFDRLITDARMSPIDGFELALQAKKICPSLRIAMISAVCSETDIASYPIETLFSKPVPVENVLAWIAGHA